MKEIIQAAVIVLIAIPFIYMAYDVTMDLMKKFYSTSVVTVNKTRPVIVSLITSLFK